MKTFLAVMLLIIIFLFLSSKSFSQDSIGSLTKETYEITTQELNLREQPNRNAKVITTIGKGEKITLISKENGWAEIITSTGEKGYVSEKYITPLKERNAKSIDIPKDFFSKLFEGFFIGWLISFLGISGIKFHKKDGRFSRGYREVNNDFGCLNVFLISIVLGLIWGFIKAYW